MTYRVIGKVYMRGCFKCPSFCKLALDNNKDIEANGADAETLNQHAVGDNIIVGAKVLETGKFGE